MPVFTILLGILSNIPVVRYGFHYSTRTYAEICLIKTKNHKFEVTVYTLHDLINIIADFTLHLNV